ncbi:MAG: DUF1194 domain-containing protein [Rhizobiales bacterium]|nr:DUF1194 domain-containing protein [Hyphomicrobiales bacterium]
MRSTYHRPRSTPTRRAVRFAAMLLFAAVTREGANAQDAVDLQLVLAVDVSGSVSPQRFELQKMGYVAAFQNPRVLSAILGGRNQSIAVTMMQWSGPFLQAQVLPWTVLKDGMSVKALAGAIESAPRMMYGGGTSISGAIDHAVTLFPQAPSKAERRIIDVSGDGSNNRGRSVTLARDEAVNAGIVINGLPILAFEPHLDQYYKDYVIGGPGAFMLAAKSFETFAEAILMKLIIEIADLPPQHRLSHAVGTVSVGAGTRR